MKEMKAPEKKAQKMTHDGAVTENLATGEVERISGREEETHFNSQEETVSFTETAVKEVAHTRHRERKAAQKDAATGQKGSETRQRPSSRLQFTDEERADPALRKYIERSDWAADKLDATKAKIPTKTVKVKERVFDETTGKGKPPFVLRKWRKSPMGSCGTILWAVLPRRLPLPPTIRFTKWSRKMWVWKLSTRPRNWRSKAYFMPEAGCGRRSITMKQSPGGMQPRRNRKQQKPMQISCTKRLSVTIPARHPLTLYPVTCRKNVSKGSISSRLARLRKQPRIQRAPPDPLLPGRRK